MYSLSSINLLVSYFKGTPYIGGLSDKMIFHVFYITGSTSGFEPGDPTSIRSLHANSGFLCRRIRIGGNYINEVPTMWGKPLTILKMIHRSIDVIPLK